MDVILIAIILGIIEGLTEFLPVSSTGHLILFNQFLELPDHFEVMFNVVIQLGAILSVVVYFRDKLFPRKSSSGAAERTQVRELWKKIFAGVMPAIIIGAILGEHIETKLFNPWVVSAALMVGGVLLIIIEGRKKSASISEVAAISYGTAIAIGFIQCLAMIPGTSRSAATIIGAMLLGCSRVVAAEFSFFLAIPTMAAASAYQIIKTGFKLSANEWLVLLAGFVTSFFVAWAVIAFLMHYLRRNDFRPFGYYRIALGLIVLAVLALNNPL